MSTPLQDSRDRAFERMYERHVKDVYRYALAVLRNPADAEDVTQTTFMNAYRAFKQGEDPLKPQNWLIKIAHNACRTRAIRASRRPQEVPIDDLLGELPMAEQARPNVRSILRALGRLPFNQRSALVMRELEGRSYEEIADTLGVTVPAVETLIFRARRSLRLRRDALGGLAAVPLPGSLQTFFDGSAVATGGAAIGGGLLIKAGAAAVAALIAGGVGYKASDASIVGDAQPRQEPRPITISSAVSPKRVARIQFAEGVAAAPASAVRRHARLELVKPGRPARPAATSAPTVSVLRPKPVSTRTPSVAPTASVSDSPWTGAGRQSRSRPGEQAGNRPDKRPVEQPAAAEAPRARADRAPGKAPSPSHRRARAPLHPPAATPHRPSLPPLPPAAAPAAPVIPPTPVLPAPALPVALPGPPPVLPARPPVVTHGPPPAPPEHPSPPAVPPTPAATPVPPVPVVPAAPAPPTAPPPPHVP